ncbi:Gypsy retrotransposon integrase-like protein 1 [Abeliophyllum distichum]|uniref:Gypsy retrotransposon integrase-like protein 1 n=1 Tax=Abeliophyllum distichum TaxID=126358 RepID=A0ABD1PE93_9LAMI
MKQPSILNMIEITNIEFEASWVDPIMNYLVKNILPEDPVEAKKMKVRATMFTMIDGQLYKWGFTIPYLKCLRPTEAKEVLFEIHARICSNHQGAATLAFKALRQGYYWPTMKKDARDLVKKCDACQRYGNLIHVPVEQQCAIFGVCPFFQWRMDILGPIPVARGQRKFLLVSIDYFTKWVEVEPLATITTAKIQVVPVEILSRTGKLNVEQLDPVATCSELDLLEGVRERSAIKMTACKQKTTEYFNRRVKSMMFQPGDLVFRSAAAAGRPPSKLRLNWEGPYEVIRSLGKRAYSLKDLKEKPIEKKNTRRSWYLSL